MFAIGDKDWPGISKLTEELGEVLQIVGTAMLSRIKLMGTAGETNHWNVPDLRIALEDELGDALAAIHFVVEKCGLDSGWISARVEEKLANVQPLAHRRHWTTMRVLLDCDGVMADFHTPCVAIINRLMGTDHAIDSFDDWDIFNALKVPEGVRKGVYAEMHRPGWCFGLPVYDGAVDGVERLRTHADVYVVTSPMNGPVWTSERDSWLKTYFGFSSKQIIHASAKHVCAGDMLVDDKIANLERWKRHNPGGVAVRWAMAHLASHPYDVGPSVTEWESLLAIVEESKMKNVFDRRWTHE